MANPNGKSSSKGSSKGSVSVTITPPAAATKAVVLLSPDMPLIGELYDQLQTDVDLIKSGAMPLDEAKVIVNNRREMRNLIGQAIQMYRLTMAQAPRAQRPTTEVTGT